MSGKSRTVMAVVFDSDDNGFEVVGIVHPALTRFQVGFPEGPSVEIESVQCQEFPAVKDEEDLAIRGLVGDAEEALLEEAKHQAEEEYYGRGDHAYQSKKEQ